MASHRAMAVARAALVISLAAGSAASASEPGIGPVAGSPASADEISYGAMFNPFGGTGASQPAAADTQRPPGDWSLPAVIALIGALGIAALVRRLLD